VSEPPVEHRRTGPVTPRRVTTPSRLRVGLVVLVAATAVFGIVSVRSVVRRLDAARAVGGEASPQLAASQDVYVSLADADAAASSALLDFVAGHDSAAPQQRYRDDIARASQQLPLMARRSGSVAARNAVTTISDQLPAYTGLVAAAHANDLQGYPVGASYLHEASQLMRKTILPAATVVYVDASSQLADGDRAGSSPVEVVAVVVLGLLVLALIVGMMVYLAVRTRRTINVGLALAAVIVIVMTATATIAFVRQQDALKRAQSRGSDPLQVLSVARILTLRTFSDDNLDLVERGATSGYQQDYKRLADGLHNSSTTGLLDSRYANSSLVADYERYGTEHTMVNRAYYNDGDYIGAVQTATSGEARALSALDDGLGRQVDAARGSLESNARHARSGLVLVAVIVSLLALTAAVAIVFGLRPRIREYA
jgi:hypothetical protein